jgi:hypothetical protein
MKKKPKNRAGKWLLFMGIVVVIGSFLFIPCVYAEEEQKKPASSFAGLHRFGNYAEYGWGHEVPAHRHINPDGSVGGWVADTAYVAPTAYIGPDAEVYDEARVGGNARVTDGAEVCDHAVVFDNARCLGTPAFVMTPGWTVTRALANMAVMF